MDIALIGKRNNWTNTEAVEPFGISYRDRREHLYIVGATGTGKTTLQRNLIIQDIRNGKGVAVLDPHGDLAEDLLDYIPRDRALNDVIYFNPADFDYPIPLNPMSNTDKGDARALVKEHILSVFTHIWRLSEATPQLLTTLENTLMALLEQKDATLLSLYRILVSREYRERIASTIQDPHIEQVFNTELSKHADRRWDELTSSTKNKANQFLASPVIRNVVGQVKNTFSFRDVIDSEKILICNLSEGLIGESASKLFGALIVNQLYIAAASRADVAEDQRTPFYMYVDEFQRFGTASIFSKILSESRKYRLSLTLAHQFTSQIDKEVRDAVFGNVRSKISFAVGAQDAELLVPEFEDLGEAMYSQKIVNLPRHSVFARIQEDGQRKGSFRGETASPFSNPFGHRDLVIDRSRRHYATERKKAERIVQHQIYR